MPEEVKEVKEEAKRGGADPEATVPRPVEDAGQGITIHGARDADWIFPETPSIAQEFIQQLKESKAPNGCIMLPGNLQYWQPCKWVQDDEYKRERSGTVRYKINEPIHFCGPSP